MVYMLDSRESDGYLVAASFGIGMYSANYTALSNKPNAPLLLYPQNDTTGILEELILSWQNPGNAYYYLLQISKDENFNDVSYEADGLSSTNHRVFDLEQGLIKYYWRVFARSAGGLSDASERGTFITAVAPPELEYPPNNASDMEHTLSLVWNESIGAQAYHLVVSENVMFTKLVADTILSSTNYEISGLKSSQRYYWKVSGINNNQEGIFSKSSSFKTKEIINVEEQTSYGNVVLLGNFPNPFVDFTDLRFYIGREQKVSIDLFDASGRKIKSLVDTNYPAGEHSLRIFRNQLSQGEYFIILESKETKLLKKITIIK